MRDEGGGASRSTDPASGTSQATDVSLREYLMQAIENSRKECKEGIRHVEESIAIAQKNAEQNIARALASIDKRFDSVNEFRNALADLSKTMATSTDLKNLADQTALRFDTVRDAVDKLNTRLDLREGQEAGSRLTTGSLIAVLTIGIGVLGLIVVIANVVTN